MPDQSDTGSAGIFLCRTSQTQEAQVYSHAGQIRHRTRGYILMPDQSDTGSAGIFSRRTNQTQAAWVYSHAAVVDGGAGVYRPADSAEQIPP
eukprot:8844113-Pyramimonas_sp.AAC.4